MGEIEIDLLRFEKEAQAAGYSRIAGVDEVGRGPLAGPVVAAAVILPEDFDLAGINDSKALTALRREKAFERIKAEALAVGVGIIDSERIDEINILQATYEAMRAALTDMGVEFDFVLVDGNQIIPTLGVRQRPIVQGDSRSVSIAAASIIAKVTRDCLMVELAEKFPEYGFAKHKGYGTKDHLDAIDAHGVCSIHRRSFGPVARKVSSDCRQKSLF